MKIKKGDQVKIIAGKDRGKTGAVIKIFEETVSRWILKIVDAAKDPDIGILCFLSPDGNR